MNNVKIVGSALKNIPWQERPENSNFSQPLWRCDMNPVIDRNPVKGVARIFNSAVLPYEDEFVGVFRGEQTDGVPHLQRLCLQHWRRDFGYRPAVNCEIPLQKLSAHAGGVVRRAGFCAECRIPLRNSARRRYRSYRHLLWRGRYIRGHRVHDSRRSGGIC